MGDVFCDFLSVTSPHDGWVDLRSEIEPVLDGIGACVEFEDGDSHVVWRAGDGTVNAKKFGPVMAVGASGAAIAQLRGMGLFGRFLFALGSRPHRVTRLDAARDVAVDAAPEIARIMAKGGGQQGIALSRKRTSPRHITKLVHRRPDDGQETGTVYVGSRSAEVRAAVYDKREERLAKGFDDPGPLLRHELRVKSSVGASLRDAADPEALFWHYMSPGLLARPEGVPVWSPHGAGFVLDGRVDVPLPAARLKRRLESSPDVAALLALAREVGPHGFDFLVNCMRDMQRGSLSALAHVVDADAVDLGAAQLHRG